MKKLMKKEALAADCQNYTSLFMLNLSVFLSSRLFIFGNINPFAASIAGIMVFTSQFFSCAPFFLLGILISGGIMYIHKYLILLIAYGAIHLIFKDEKALSVIKKSALCCLSLLLANALDILITGFNTFKAVSYIGEVFMCGAGIIILDSCPDIIFNSQLKESLSKTEIISISLLAAVSVSGASTFGEWSLLFTSAAAFIFSTFIFSLFSNNLSQEYAEYVKKAVKNKLKDFSSSFARLSNAFSDLSQESASAEKDVKKAVESIAEKVCEGCDNYNYCWSINFYGTYKEIDSLFSKYEKNGKLTPSSIKGELSQYCPRRQSLCDNISSYTNLLQTNISWQKKNLESRSLISRQLKSVSSLMDQLSEDIIENTSPDGASTKIIVSRLREKGIKFYSAAVLNDKDEKKEIILTVPPCYGMKKCVKKIIPIINECMGAKFVRSCPQCITSYSDGKSVCSLRLFEKQRFRISWYAAKETKTGSQVSGDNYALLTMTDGRFLIALSDAMGSGSGASMESAATVELFEDFINAGFDKATAIDLINSALVLKSEKDSFSTLDSTIINLQTGCAEFIKICAAPTFIKHDDKTEIIRSSSLPVGILPSADSQTSRRRLIHNDVLVMVTDGITDVLEPAGLRDLISSLKTANPKAIASAILEEAKQKSNSIINDDLTVIALRFWEKDY